LYSQEGRAKSGEIQPEMSRRRGGERERVRGEAANRGANSFTFTLKVNPIGDIHLLPW